MEYTQRLIETRMKIAVIGLTAGGRELARNIASRLNADFLDRTEKFPVIIAQKWREYDAFICVMATGIVVRAIARLIEDKAVDPCVLVLDEKGKNVISLLSGHLGGGNALTEEVANILQANPVITTASDTLNKTALDLWAQHNRLVPPPRPELTALSARLVNEGSLLFYCDCEITEKFLPSDLVATEECDKADFIISLQQKKWRGKPLFSPRTIVIGTGCNRGTPASEFTQAINDLCKDLDISRKNIYNLASIDAKNDEQGLLEFARENGWKIDFFTKEELNTFKNLDISTAAMKAVGAIGVAEPACLLSAKSGTLLQKKRKWKNITMAAALVPFTLSVPDREIRSL